MTMKVSGIKRLSCTAAVFAVAAVAGCSLPSDTATNTAALASGDFSDGEILQALVDLNNGEIRQAKLVQQNSTNDELLDTAEQIIEDHRRANERIDAFVASGVELEKSPLSRGLAMQTEQIREQLTDLSGTEFDCAYLEKQIEQHELALKTVREDLQPDAESQEIRQFLSSMAPRLEHHLSEAQNTQNSMQQCTS